jgi:prepilin-type N-terminal cleavage/methylation domain-containing protein
LRSKLNKRLRDVRGFTLIELMVTVLLIGILAAIAIPAYIDHNKKGKDADAESNARNLVSKVELCYATNEDYTTCNDETKLGGAGEIGIPYGTSPGQASVVESTKMTFKVTAISDATSDDSHHTFSITKGVSGTSDKSCTAGTTNNNGSCKNGAW